MTRLLVTSVRGANDDGYGYGAILGFTQQGNMPAGASTIALPPSRKTCRRWRPCTTCCVTSGCFDCARASSLLPALLAMTSR